MNKALIGVAGLIALVGALSFGFTYAAIATIMDEVSNG